MSKPPIHATEQTEREEAGKVAELKKLFGPIPEDLTVKGDQEAAYRRFLVARKWTVADSHKLLLEIREWRSKFQVDAFLSSAKARDSTRKLRDVVPANPVLGYAYSGHPVSLLRIGAINVDLLASTVTPEEMLSEFVVKAEFFNRVVFPEATDRHGQTIDKEIALIDMEGMGMSFFKVVPAFKALNKVGAHFFPERTHTMLILNAPRIFSSIWSIIKPLVDPRTQKKILIFSGGAKQLAALKERLPMEHIPEAYGGLLKGTCTGGVNPADTKQIFAKVDEWLSTMQVQKLRVAVPGHNNSGEHNGHGHFEHCLTARTTHALKSPMSELAQQHTPPPSPRHLPLPSTPTHRLFESDPPTPPKTPSSSFVGREGRPPIPRVASATQVEAAGVRLMRAQSSPHASELAGGALDAAQGLPPRSQQAASASRGANEPEAAEACGGAEPGPGSEAGAKAASGGAKLQGSGGAAPDGSDTGAEVAKRMTALAEREALFASQVVQMLLLYALLLCVAMCRGR